MFFVGFASENCTSFPKKLFFPKSKWYLLFLQKQPLDQKHFSEKFLPVFNKKLFHLQQYQTKRDLSQ